MKHYMVLAILSFCCLGFSVRAQQEDPAVTEKLRKMLAAKYPNAGADSRGFIYNLVDLNDDGKNEVLVGLTGMEFCGSGGCRMLVLNPSLKVLTTMSVVGFPVSVGAPGTPETTKGYSNLYVYSKGKGYVKLAWNGKTYPTNPSLAPVVPESVVKEKYKFLDEQSQTRYTFQP